MWQRRRYAVVACGRRFGKTHLGMSILMAEALAGARTWWLAPTYAMANEVWHTFKMALRGVAGLRISETEHQIDLRNGGLIAIRSTHNPDNLRGVGLDFVVLDEAAFMEPHVWPQIVQPMLLDRRGAALFLSTPRGHNHFYELYKRGLDPMEPEWISFRLPTWVNESIALEDLADIRRNTPERIYREEYEAEFIADAGQVFRDIRAVATAPRDARPDAQRVYVAGIDWGREHDYTAIAIIDTATGHMVALDRFTGVRFRLQRDRLMALYRRWQPAVIYAEANSIGAPNIEALQEAGLPVRPFMTTGRSKPALIEGLALAIERREIALLPDDVLINELAAYSMERLPGGGYRYGAPAGSHDDTVIATALAWHGARYGGARVDFV